MIPSVPTLRSSDLTEVVDRAAPAEHLVDRSVPEAGVVAQALGLVGMLDEGEHRVVDEVAGGLVAGHHERDEEQVELEVVEALAVELGLQDRKSVVEGKSVSVRVDIGGGRKN